jgi:hypothetical protein
MMARRLTKLGVPRNNKFSAHMRMFNKTMTRRLTALLPFVFGVCAIAQNSTGAPSSGQPVLPSVSFTLDFPRSIPDHYSFRVLSDGHTTYESKAKLSEESDDEDSFQIDFVVSPATRARIFDLAARARYFDGPINSNKKNIASTGKKTLAYKDSQRNTEATYNYSSLPVVQDLTALFQNMSTTLEFGRRLQYDHSYQKLALDEELKRMEEMAKSNSLAEMQAVGTVLSKIIADDSVINVVRARAQRLLVMADGPTKR